MHQDGVAPLDKGWAIACALRLVLAHPGGSGCVEIHGSRYWWGLWSINTHDDAVHGQPVCQLLFATQGFFTFQKWANTHAEYGRGR